MDLILFIHSTDKILENEVQGSKYLLYHIRLNYKQGKLWTCEFLPSIMTR